MPTLLQKEQEIIDTFSSCQKPEDVYNKVIEIGQKERRKAHFDDLDEKNLVPGCQSLLYLTSTLRDGNLYFEVHSDALISMGLAQLLVRYYNGETAETILKAPPTFLEKLGIPSSLTPSRANGLYSIHLKMKQKALEVLVSSS